MFIRCPRCALAFGAPSAGAPCPRCGAPGVESGPALPPTSPSLAMTPPTQVAPIYGAHTQPMAQPHPAAPPVQPTQVAPPPVQRTQLTPPPAAAWSPAAQAPRYAWAAPPPAREDRGAIAGRAAMATVLSTLAIVGCCNPLGWVGLLLALRAYAATGDADLGPAADRAATARTVALIAFGSTTLIWFGGVALWLEG